MKTISNQTTYPDAYQQALDDFGITQLLSYLQQYSDADFSAVVMNVEEQEIESLAAMLIQHLLSNLKGKLIASYLNALRHGDSDVQSRPSNQEIPLPSLELPANFAEQITPRYQEGDRVRWRLVTNSTDWGTIIGHFYGYAPHLSQWSVYYLIRLAADSPSSSWTVTDIAWEDDLESLSGVAVDSRKEGIGNDWMGIQNPPDTVQPIDSRNSHPTPSLEANNSASQTSSLLYPLIQQYLHTPPGKYRYGRTTERILTQREQEIIELYSYCQLGMTPQRFYAKWPVNQERIAMICSRSISTVRRWFSRGRNYRRPMSNDLRHLAVMDFLLEHFEKIPQELRNLLNC